MSAKLDMPTSPDMLLSMLHSAPELDIPCPRVLGVDDWAIRKGQTYGKILVDLETHQPVDLLPDRISNSLVKWLQAHPRSEIRIAVMLSRLGLILATITLFLVSTGTATVHWGLFRYVDTHWKRGLSYFQIGWRWLLHSLANCKPLTPRF